MTGKEALSISLHKLFEISMENKNRGHGYKLNKKQTGTMWNRYFSAWVVNLWDVWEDCCSRHSREIQKKAEWVWILGYGSGSYTDNSSLLNHSKLLLCYVNQHVLQVDPFALDLVEVMQDEIKVDQASLPNGLTSRNSLRAFWHLWSCSSIVVSWPLSPAFPTRDRTRPSRLTSTRMFLYNKRNA